MGQVEGGGGADADVFPGYGFAVDGAGEQAGQQEPSDSSESHLNGPVAEGKEHEAGEREYDGGLRVLELVHVLLELTCILQKGGILGLNNEGTRGVGDAAALSADKVECIVAARGVEAGVDDAGVGDAGKLPVGEGGEL